MGFQIEAHGDEFPNDSLEALPTGFDPLTLGRSKARGPWDLNQSPKGRVFE